MDQFIELLIDRFINIGKIPLCNGLASRAPELFGFCFPLCYRCTFIFLFLALSYIVIKKREDISIKWTPFLMLPMIIDGCLQTFWMIESTNIRRSITGALFGIALAVIIKKLYVIIDKEKPA